MLDYDEIASKFDDFTVSLFEKIDLLGKLEKAGDRRALEIIKSHLSNSDQYIRREAILALGNSGDQAHIDSILPLIEDSDSEVRKNVIVALGKMGGARAEEAIRKAHHDESWIVRYYAESALAVLQEKTLSSSVTSPAMGATVYPSSDGAMTEGSSAYRSGKKPLSVDEIIQQVVIGTGITSEKNVNGFVLTIYLQEARKQRVFISFHESEGDKTELIIFYTACGKASSSLYKWALTANAKMVYGGIALRQIEGEDYFTISYATPFWTATPESLRKIVKDIAAKGDWIEKNLSKNQEDRF
jgi:hypothetical protein